MYIESIRVKNFRNYESLQLHLDPGVNVLIGSNGQGKTNILEAVYLLTCARSHRTAKDQELIFHGKHGYEVELSFLAEDRKVPFQEKLRLRYIKDYRAYEELDEKQYEGIPSQLASQKGKEPSKKRFLFHDDGEVERIADFCGIFHAVIFAPEDLLMIKEGPAVRRRFLDLLIAQAKKTYFKELQTLQRILIQRNCLLKQIREAEKKEKAETFSSSFSEEKKDELLRAEREMTQKKSLFLRAQLNVWNERFARSSALIIRERKKTLKELEERAARFHHLMSSHKEDFSLKYAGFSKYEEDESEEKIINRLVRRLKEEEQEDILRGSTSTGPHRDDLEFYLNGKNVKSFGSQGQQRSVVLSLKIAELEWLEQEIGQKPVLLLDDVMSELDPLRRQALIQAVQGLQVVITCTDLQQLNQDWSEFKEFEHGKIFQVEAAHVRDLKIEEN